jgi:predicted phosphatase
MQIDKFNNYNKRKYFIVFDLDGTLINENTVAEKTLLSDVKDSLYKLHSEGHFLSVCSNNVMAKFLLNSFGILDCFDVVIGHSSSTNKSLELLEICKYYRYVNNIGLMKTKIRMNQVLFVDNDHEVTDNIKNLQSGAQTCNSVVECMQMINENRTFTITCLKSKSMRLLSKEVMHKYHVDSMPLLGMLHTEEKTVWLSTSAKSESNRKGAQGMKYHTKRTCKALLRDTRTMEVEWRVAELQGHSICRICHYNAQQVETDKFCCA